MGCDADHPDQCTCSRISGDPRLPMIQEIQPWCNYAGLGRVNGCCYSIGKSYKSLNLTYDEYNCRLPNMTTVSQKPELCRIPCSASFPENCSQCSSTQLDKSVVDINDWCSSGHSECCYNTVIDIVNTRWNAHTRNCSVLNSTMVTLNPTNCANFNWRFPITSGSKCFTSAAEDKGLLSVKQDFSLGDGFICMNYFSWYEPLGKYVAVSTTGDEELYSSLALFPNSFMMLEKCSTDYCNDPVAFEQKYAHSFTPHISGFSGPGLMCLKGIYPNVNSEFVYNADVCVRYSFQPNFNSSIVTVYDGLPSSFLAQLQGTSYAQNVTACSASNCNSVVTPSTSNGTSSVISPNLSGNLKCFRSVDSDGLVIPHPNPLANPDIKYCVIVTSALDGTKMFFPAKSYASFSQFSKTSNYSVCNTDFCNSSGSSSNNLSCYLTDPRNVTNHIQSNLVLPVDYCVKYRTAAGVRYFSGVTTAELAVITASSKVTELESCQSNFCLVP